MSIKIQAALFCRNCQADPKIYREMLVIQNSENKLEEEEYCYRTQTY